MTKKYKYVIVQHTNGDMFIVGEETNKTRAKNNRSLLRHKLSQDSNISYEIRRYDCDENGDYDFDENYIIIE